LGAYRAAPIAICAVCLIGTAPPKPSTSMSTFVDNVIDGMIQESLHYAAMYDASNRAGAAKRAREQASAFRGFKRVALIAKTAGFGKDLYDDPVWRMVQKALETTGEKAISSVVAAAFRQAGEALERRLVFGLAIALDVVHPEMLAKDPEEVLFAKASSKS